jgi:hypothetical protein
MLLSKSQTVAIAQLLRISVEKRFYLISDKQLVSSNSLRIRGINYPVNFSCLCEKEREAVVKQGELMQYKIQKLTDHTFKFEVTEGFRILKDTLGVGSKYDVDVNKGEVHHFPVELHDDPPVVFFSQEKAFDVLVRLVRYATQTILVRGKWGGHFCKTEIKTILKQ